MASQRKVMKIIVIIILAIFVLSSALVSVMYFVDMNKSNSANELYEEMMVDEDSDDELIDISNLGL